MFDRVTRAVQAKKTQQDTQHAEGMRWLRRNEVGVVVSPLSGGSRRGQRVGGGKADSSSNVVISISNIIENKCHSNWLRIQVT